MQGSSTTLYALGLTVALLLVVSSGAVVLDSPNDSIDEDVTLQPGDNPYASLNEDGELAIDVSEDNPDLDADGVNPNALSAESELFYITYNGSEYVDAWIEHDSEAVTFVVDGQPIESRNDSVRLTPTEGTVPVGIEVDTRVASITPGDSLIDGISVNARIAEPEDLESQNDDDDDSGSTTMVNAPDPTTRQVGVYSIAANDETEVDLLNLHVGSPSIQLHKLSFIREAPGDVEFSVEGSANAPTGIGPVDRPGIDALGYYTVAFEQPNQPIESATAKIVVERDRLNEAGITPEQLTVYYKIGDSDDWSVTDLRVVGETEDTVQFTIESDGFSTFALGVQSPVLDPVDAEVVSESVAPDETVRLNLTLSNEGLVPAEGAGISIQAIEANVDNPDVIDTERVTVNVGPDKTVMRTVTFEPNEPGEYNVLVDGNEVTELEPVASFVIREPEPVSTDPDEGASTGSVPSSASGETVPPETGLDRTEDEGAETQAELVELNDFELGGLVGLALLIAMVLATLFLVRRA